MTASHFSTADRTKLAKLLGMLNSARVGERDAAALAANRFLRDRNLTWPQMLEPVLIKKTLPELGTWRVTVSRCLARSGSLRPWEISFLRDLPGFQRLSTKQRYVLKEIADRVLDRRAA